ncbi:hypothetical protein ACFQVC_06285 [Streptomyces monticola]|uniref:MFS transporter n=1 Tax=Streptomyces monticola TaxID=2666263 RepID=A0ABW2JDE3_9ACTN
MRRLVPVEDAGRDHDEIRAGERVESLRGLRTQAARCVMGAGPFAVGSYHVFAERPSTGFTATVFFLGLGTFTGPAALGAFADHHGLGPAFLLTAALAVAPLLARPVRGARREVLVTAGGTVAEEQGSSRAAAR